MQQYNLVCMLCLFTSVPSPMACKKHPQVIHDEINSAQAKAIEAALEDIYTHGFSLQKASLKYGIPASTLSDHTRGSQTLSEFNAAKAHFTADEATVLVDWILFQLQQGFPFTDSQLLMISDHLFPYKSLSSPPTPLSTHLTHTY